MSLKDKKISRRHSTEKAVAQNLLGDFEVKNSRGLSIIEAFMGENAFESISRNSLLSLTTILSKLTQIPFPRNFSRRKALIVKWFDDNAEELEVAEKFVFVEFGHENHTLKH